MVAAFVLYAMYFILAALLFVAYLAVRLWGIGHEEKEKENGEIDSKK